jgi:hypothetical protein
MGEILWGHRLPGEDVTPVEEEPGLLVIGAPDWVRVDGKAAELLGEGGGVRRVLGVFTAKCGFPGHEHDTRHFALDGPIWCFECLADRMFGWYRPHAELLAWVSERLKGVANGHA